MDELSGFSREHGYPRCRRPPKGTAYCRLSARGVDLPAPLITYGLQRTFPSVRGGFTSPSPHRSMAGSRNVDRVCHPPRRSAER